MKKRKFVFTAAIVLMVAVTCVALLTSCNSDGKYVEKISSYKFWDNELSQAIAQPSIHDIVMDHMRAPLAEGTTTKKVAFIGYDGCRADALTNAFMSGVLDKDGNDIYSGASTDSHLSAVVSLSEQGGIYHAFAGGEKGKDNQQYTSTGPGWCALTTGQWGIKNGITNNGMPKNLDYKTFMLELAETGAAITGGEAIKYDTQFAASWGPHFTENYTPEIKYLCEHGGIGMNFVRGDDDEQVWAATKAALTVGGGDVEMRVWNDMTDKDSESSVKTVNITEKDVVFCTIEGTDHNGHSTGFGNDNRFYVRGFNDEDAMAYELLQTIYNRASYDTEDWLIIITTDHGGVKTWHGGQTLEERNTWIACNKKIDAKYFSNGYDGFVINK